MSAPYVTVLTRLLFLTVREIDPPPEREGGRLSTVRHPAKGAARDKASKGFAAAAASAKAGARKRAHCLLFKSRTPHDLDHVGFCSILCDQRGPAYAQKKQMASSPRMTTRVVKGLSSLHIGFYLSTDMIQTSETASRRVLKSPKNWMCGSEYPRSA